MLGTLRAVGILLGFMVLTVPLMPVQALFLRVSRAAARAFPHHYHKLVCRLIGVRMNVTGTVARDHPVLIVANHTSWLDIPVLSAVAPISFVAKKEVGGWPFVATLARLQRTVFVDRARRSQAAEAANAMLERLATGDAIVLFAEGTSTDGNRVLAFKTSLFGAVKPPLHAQQPPPGTVVQTLALVYTRVHGLPLGRAQRPRIGWYGDMELGGHLWELLKWGPLDAEIRIGPPVPIDDFEDRKALAQFSETEVRTAVTALLRCRGDAPR